MPRTFKSAVIAPEWLKQVGWAGLQVKTDDHNMQVIDLISLKPFDMETISKSIKKTRNAIIVEECMKTGGIGASLSAMVNESLFDELDHQVLIWHL